MPAEPGPSSSASSTRLASASEACPDLWTGVILGGMWGIVLLLLAAWVVVSILGLVIKGLFWLFIIGLILFVLTSVFGWAKRTA